MDAAAPKPGSLADSVKPGDRLVSLLVFLLVSLLVFLLAFPRTSLLAFPLVPPRAQDTAAKVGLDTAEALARHHL